jgi:hypothetical protein
MALVNHCQLLLLLHHASVAMMAQSDMYSQDDIISYEQDQTFIYLV